MTQALRQEEQDSNPWLRQTGVNMLKAGFNGKKRFLYKGDEQNAHCSQKTNNPPLGPAPDSPGSAGCCFWKSLIRVLSMIWPAGTHDRSSGPYPSQFTRYWNPRPRCCAVRSFLTVYTRPPSTRRGGGGGLDAGTSGLSWTGFSLDTLNVGWTFMDMGSLSLTDTGLIIFWYW